MSPEPAWFSCLGTPLAPADRQEITALLHDHGVATDAEVVVVGSWWDAARVLQASDRDPRWWDWEEAERERLWSSAADRHGEAHLLEQLTATTGAQTAAIRRAAETAAARERVGDADLIRAAAAAALLAVHQGGLAELAGADARHRFRRKLALFAAGRWPMGFCDGRFFVF